MSLKAFHVFFICTCVLFSFFLGAIGLRRYIAAGDGVGLGLAVVFYPAGIGLALYAQRFLKKLKALGV